MNDRIYIARAVDGSWAAPNVAVTEQQARDQIAEHEPDVSKHSQYQILVETIGRLLADQIPGIQRGIRQRLVKWDGDSPIPPDADQNPQKYAQVAEVMEGGDGIDPKVIYRRS